MLSISILIKIERDYIGLRLNSYGVYYLFIYRIFLKYKNNIDYIKFIEVYFLYKYFLYIKFILIMIIF